VKDTTNELKNKKTMDTDRYTVCFVCTGNACRSPFAESVTRTLLAKEGMCGIDVFSVGVLDWGENPRDAVMADVAKELGYELVGTTTHMTRGALLAADAIVVFEEAHRNAITRVLDYGHWDKIVLFDRVAFGEESHVEDPFSQAVAVYRQVAVHIEAGCKRLVALWKEHPPKPKG